MRSLLLILTFALAAVMAAPSDAGTLGIHECPCKTGTVVSNIRFWRPRVSAFGIVIAYQSMIIAVPRGTAMYSMLPGMMGQINEEGIYVFPERTREEGNGSRKLGWL
jgi:hypothetical protein